jgi:L-lactate dehydrogenase (cytochrome)
MVGTNPSCTHEEIAASRVSPSQPLIFQFYKNSDDAIAERFIRRIEKLEYKAIFLTVDAPVLGKRERDERAPFEQEDEESEHPSVYNESSGEKEIDSADGSVSSTFSKQDDPNKSWDKVKIMSPRVSPIHTDLKTIPWLRSITSLPIVLKGQSESD